MMKPSHEIISINDYPMSPPRRNFQSTSELPVKHSWEYIPYEVQVTILLKSFELFSTYLSTIFGFQSFIISYDYYNNNEIHFSFMIMLYSFTTNFFIFIICILFQNAILNGLYRNWYWKVYQVCVSLFGLSMFGFYFSFMHMIYEFYDKEVEKVMNIYVWGTLCTMMTVGCHFWIEYTKLSNYTEERAILLKKLKI